MEEQIKFLEIKKLNLYLERDPLLDITPEKNLNRQCRGPKVKFNENVDVFIYHSLEQDHGNSEFIKDVNPSNSFGSLGYNQYDDDFSNSQINHDANEIIDHIHHHGYTCMTNNHYDANNYAVYDENVASENLSNRTNNQELSSSEDHKFETIDRSKEYINDISPTTSFVDDVLKRGQDYDVNDGTYEPSYAYKEYVDNPSVFNEDIMKEFEEILGPSSIIYDDDHDDDTWWDDECDTNCETESNEFTNNTKPSIVYKTPHCNSQIQNRSINENKNKIQNNINKSIRIKNLKKNKENKNCLSSNYSQENNLKNHREYTLQNITNNVNIARNKQEKVFNKNIVVCRRGLSNEGMIDLEKPLLNGSKRLLERLRKTKLQYYTGDVHGGTELSRKLCKQASLKLNVEGKQFENLIPLEVDSQQFLDKVVRQKFKQCKRYKIETLKKNELHE